MSIRCMARVWEHSRHKGSALLLLLAIADHAHDDGSGAWPSVAHLAGKVRMTDRNVQRLLHVLEAGERAELAIERGQGPGGTHLFTVRVDVTGEKLSPPADTAVVTPLVTPVSPPGEAGVTPPGDTRVTRTVPNRP